MKESNWSEDFQNSVYRGNELLHGRTAVGWPERDGQASLDCPVDFFLLPNKCVFQEINSRMILWYSSPVFNIT